MSKFKIVSLSATSSTILKALQEKGALHYQVVKRAPTQRTIYVSPIVDDVLAEDTVIALEVNGPVRLLRLREVVTLDLDAGLILQTKSPEPSESDTVKAPVKSPVRRVGCSKAFMPTN